MTTPNDLLDLAPGIGQVASSVRYTLLSNLLQPIGEVHPFLDSTPSISLSVRSTVMRTCRNLVLRGDEANDVDVFRDAIQPRWVLEDGTEWPMGVFYFTGRSKNWRSDRLIVPVSMGDGGVLLGEKSDRTIAIPPYGDIGKAMDDVVARAGIVSVERPFVDARTLEPQAWPAGTTWGTILGDLCQMVGFFPPHFSNEGILRLRPASQLDESVPDHTYLTDETSRVVVDSVVEEDNLLEMPNAHIVVSGDSVNSEIWAIAYVDWYAPNSVERIGRIKPEVHKVQGLADTASAQKMANAFAAAQQVNYREITFSSTPDPRHDVYDVVNFNNSLYRETAWSIGLKPGSDMSHTIVKSGAVW